jgi:hypothetical protein
MSDSAQEIWDRYYANIKDRRLTEAAVLWLRMTADGVTNETMLALDFVHFSQNRDGAHSLQQQLSENYVSLVAEQEDSWLISTTTRPYGRDLNEEQHLKWVEFMCDVAQSHGCVFSTWSFESPKLKLKWSTEEIDC